MSRLHLSTTPHPERFALQHRQPALQKERHESSENTDDLPPKGHPLSALRAQTSWRWTNNTRHPAGVSKSMLST
jgi:hypothetical protein